MKPDQRIPVFVIEGMNFMIPAFSIRFEDGQVIAHPVELHTEIDVTPIWLDISFDHVKSCECAKLRLDEAVRANDEVEIGNALIAELRAGMQAIMTSCTAIDAYYACVKSRIDIPDTLQKAWTTNRTARFRQISEVLRLAMPMSSGKAEYLRNALEQNLSWRDQAVHPSSGTKLPVVHETLNKATDWRFAKFRYCNAHTIARLNFDIVHWTAEKADSSKYPDVRQYCQSLKTKLSSLAEQWEARYGKVFD